MFRKGEKNLPGGSMNSAKSRSKDDVTQRYRSMYSNTSYVI